MVLNIKNLFKKVCMLSAAATMAVGLGASFAGATTPNASTLGTHVGSTAISKSTNGNPIATIVLNATQTFTGGPLQLISSITSVTLGDQSLAYTGNAASVKLYLRVADTEETSTTTANWVEYTEAQSGDGSLSDTNLTRTNSGTYHVYYYIDGGNNCNDSSSS